MSNDVNMILEKMKIAPSISSGKKSIVILSNKDVNLSAESFDEAIEYIWENKLVKVLKVERNHVYIVKVYVDIAV